MKNWFLEQGLPLYAEIFLFAAGLFALWITSRNYKRLIHEADSMGTSEHRLMKYIRVKVTSCFKIGMRPDDLQSLVGRYIKKHRLGLFSLETWSRLPYLCMTGILAVGGGHMMYRWMEDIGNSMLSGAESYMTSSIGVYLTASTFGIAVFESMILFGLVQFENFKEKEKMLMYTISDYVGNYLNHKLAYEYKDQAGNVAPEQYKRMLQEVAASGVARRREKRPKYYYDEYEQGMQSSRNDEVDARIVEDVLKEFLC